MRKRAGEYRKQSQNVNSVIKEMDKLLNILLTEWEGASSTAYNEKYKSLRPGFVAAKDLIDDIATALDKTAKALEDTDSTIAKQFKA